MPNPNVYFPVPDPDSTMNGTNPAVPFAASHAELWRYTSQANARGDITGTLVATFTLIASTEQRTDAAGPFRFGTYDASLLGTSWYAYRFRDALSIFFSEFSAPWQPGGRLLWTFRDVVRETAKIMGMDAYHEGTATGGDLDSVNCANLFKSALRDESYWTGSYLWLHTTGDALAPQDEEKLISAVDTATGIATLDNDLSATVGNGDVFGVLPLFPAALVKQGINTVRKQMKTLIQTPIAMNLSSNAGNLYPLPQGVYTKADIARARWWSKAADIGWEFAHSTAYEVEFDGNQAWLVLLVTPAADILMVEHKVNYYELEGPLEDLNDTTRANIEWLTKAAAWWTYSQIDRSEEAEGNFARLVGITRVEVMALTGTHEPTITAQLSTGNREWVGPTPAPV